MSHPTAKLASTQPQTQSSSSRPSWLRFVSAYAPPILWAIFIFLLSSQSVLPGLDVSTLDFVFKKSAHMFVYGVLFLLLQRSVFTTTTPAFQAKHQQLLWILPLLLTLIYAAADELHQTFVPGRYGTFRDICFDMTGVLVAFLKRYDYI